MRKTYQAHEVEATIASLGMLERSLDVLQLTKLLLGGGEINADNILLRLKYIHRNPLPQQ